MSEEKQLGLDPRKIVGALSAPELAKFTEKHRLRLALRILAVLLFLAFASACYEEWAPALSPESVRYQNDYPDSVRSGFSLWYGLSRFLWVVGTSCGVVGTLFVAITKRQGLIATAAAAPLIAIAAALQAPQETYPSVEPISTLLLWCVSSALWAGVVALAWVSRQFDAN